MGLTIKFFDLNCRFYREFRKIHFVSLKTKDNLSFIFTSNYYIEYISKLFLECIIRNFQEESVFSVQLYRNSENKVLTSFQRRVTDIESAHESFLRSFSIGSK